MNLNLVSTAPLLNAKTWMMGDKLSSAEAVHEQCSENIAGKRCGDPDSQEEQRHISFKA